MICGLPILRARTAARSVDERFHRARIRYESLARTILNSRSYQASSKPNNTNGADDRFYSRYIVRRLGAEPLLDCVCQVTGEWRSLRARLRVREQSHCRYPYCVVLWIHLAARPASDMRLRAQYGANVAQALHMISATTLNAKVTAKGGIVISESALESRTGRLLKNSI